MKTINIYPSSPVLYQEMKNLKFFYEKFQILNAHKDELNIRQSGGFGASRNPQGKVSGDTLGKSINSLKGFFMDYRFFHAQKEQTNYFNVAKFIGNKFKDERLFLLLKEQKDSWKSAETFHSFCGVNADELINVLFNTEFFHIGDKEQISANQTLKTKIDYEFQLKLLSDTIHDRILVLKNLCWIIEPLIKGNDFIRLPEDHLNTLQERKKLEKKNKETENIEALKEENRRKRALEQEKFNREKSFDSEMISRVYHLYFGCGYNAEDISNNISSLCTSDAQGIINNIEEESRLRQEKAEKLQRKH